jgi:hypothetical protein
MRYNKTGYVCLRNQTIAREHRREEGILNYRHYRQSVKSGILHIPKKYQATLLCFICFLGILYKVFCNQSATIRKSCQKH